MYRFRPHTHSGAPCSGYDHALCFSDEEAVDFAELMLAAAPDLYAAVDIYCGAQFLMTVLPGEDR